MTVERTSRPEETEAIGARLAAQLRLGDVVLVVGELGAGKTTLIRGACRALGVGETVVSPTFTIGRRYTGRLPISHLDLFRVESLAEEDPGLLDDYLDAQSVAFVEWPPEVAPELGERAGAVIRVEIRHAGGDHREVRVGAREVQA